MKHIATIILCSSALLMACRGGNDDAELGHHHHNHSHEAGHSHSHEGHTHAGEEAVEAPGGHDEGEIVLMPDMARRFGVEVDTLAAAPMVSSVRATGVVLDAADGSAVVSAPAAGIVRFAKGISPGAVVRAGSTVAMLDTRGVAGGDANAAANAALDAARREYERLEPLHADRLVTDDVYNAARAAYESARAAYSSSAAGGRVAAPITGTLTSLSVAQGQYVEAGAPIAVMSAATRLLLRVDVPERLRSRIAAADGVNIRVPGSEEIVTLAARRVASAPAVSASMPGYVPVYFEFDNDGSVAPGSALDAWLTSAGSGEAVLSVPRTAIAEQQGGYFVYVRTGDETYEKLPVRLGASDGMRVVIASGLKGGERVVTRGVTAVRLAETSGVVPEGHSHNH